MVSKNSVSCGWLPITILVGNWGSVYVSRLRNVDTRVLRCVLSSHINGAGLHASGQLVTPSNFWGRQSELQSRKIELYVYYIYIFFFLNKFCETEAVSEWAQQCGAEDGFFGPEADVWGCGVVFFCILTGLACLDMAGASGVEDVSHGGILPDKMTRGCRVWRWTARGYTWFMVELISNFA